MVSRSFLFLSVRTWQCTKVSRSGVFSSEHARISNVHSKRHGTVSENIRKLPIKVQPSFVGWIRKCRARFENVTKATRIKHAYLALNRAMVTRRFDSIESFEMQLDGMLGSLVGFTWQYVDSSTLFCTRIPNTKLKQDQIKEFLFTLHKNSVQDNQQWGYDGGALECLKFLSFGRIFNVRWKKYARTYRFAVVLSQLK